MLNTILVLVFMAALGIAAYSILSLWDSKQRKKLIELAQSAYPTDEEADVEYWGNDCLLILYSNSMMAVGVSGSIAKAMPAGAILGTILRQGISGGTSTLTIRLNDVAHPEMTLVFPNDMASQANSSLDNMLSRFGISENNDTEENQKEGHAQENEEILEEGQFIDSSADAEAKTIIVAPEPEKDNEKSFIINEFNDKKYINS
jgi:hypothetical protein